MWHPWWYYGGRWLVGVRQYVILILHDELERVSYWMGLQWDTIVRCGSTPYGNHVASHLVIFVDHGRRFNILFVHNESDGSTVIHHRCSPAASGNLVAFHLVLGWMMAGRHTIVWYPQCERGIGARLFMDRPTVIQDCVVVQHPLETMWHSFW